MRALSFWAKDHKWASRFLIIFVLYPLLNLVAVVFGDLLSSFRIVFGLAWYYPFILLVCTVALTYPSKKRPYNYRKLADYLLAFCTFCVVTILSNRIDTIPGSALPANSAIAATPLKVMPLKPGKGVKKNFKKLVHDLRKKYRDGSKAEKVIFIILLILLAIGLLYLLAGLACTLSCNGMEVLALVVFILGALGIVIGLTAAIRSVSRKHPKQKETTGKAS